MPCTSPKQHQAAPEAGCSWVPPSAHGSLKTPRCLVGSPAYCLLTWEGWAGVTSEKKNLFYVQALREFFEYFGKAVQLELRKGGDCAKRTQRQQLTFSICFYQTKTNLFCALFVRNF